MAKLTPEIRARKIKLLLFDVDGVLTDGKLFFLPAVSVPNGVEAQGRSSLSSPSQIEFKGFHAHDGAAISLARIGGIQTGLITKRASETVARRASDLKLDYVYQGVNDKRNCFLEIVKKAGMKPEQAAFVGDDVIDPVSYTHLTLPTKA